MDVYRIRKDFPILKRKINGHRLIYLDNAASSQKPVQVIEAMKHVYGWHYSNIHRSIHELGEEATEFYETSRKEVANFIKSREEEIIFTKGATESINIVMRSYANKFLKRGEKIVTTVMEHHSNLVPWQILSKRGIKLEFINVNKYGELDEEDIHKKIDKNTKFVAITHISNVLGTINPIKEIVEIAHEHNAKVLVDGAQSVGHIPINVKKLDIDFLAFSGHKMLGPSGVGVLYGKYELLDKMDPFLYGSEMIKRVWLKKSIFMEPPTKFEPGTPNIVGVIGLGEAIRYLKKVGVDNIQSHVKKLTKYALRKMEGLEVNILGSSSSRTGIISFTSKLHAHDIAYLLNKKGIAVRSGHMCAQPLLDIFKVNAVTRASFYIYNTKREIDIFVKELENIIKRFK